jgi:hypothetical protein
MTAREELRAAVEGKPPPVDHAASLTAALGLDTIGRKVVGASIFGRGPEALVDVLLDNGERIAFARFADITKPAIVNATLITTLGVITTIKGPEAAQIAATIHKLAKHHAEVDEDTAVHEFGVEFLRFAPTIDVAMSDQRERWEAFSALARMNPSQDSGEDRSAATYAAACTVLVDTQTAARYVRAGWLQAFVKREVGGLYSPERLARTMLRIGWTRPGGQGRVKATNPMDGRTLQWPFYVVPDGWETGQVTAGNSSNARVRVHTRDLDLPAVTRDLAEEPRRHVDGTSYDPPPAWMPERGGRS